jgi:hypothetical protein
MKRSTPRERKARDWRHNDRPGRAWRAEKHEEAAA